MMEILKKFRAVVFAAIALFLLHSLQKTPDLSGAECKGVVRHRSTPTSVVKP